MKQGLSIAICGSQTHTEVIACDWRPKFLTTRPLENPLKSNVNEPEISST